MNEVLAIASSVVSVVLIFGVRTWLQHRRTGDTGWRGFRAGASAAERIGTTLFVLGLVAAVFAPVLALVAGPSGVFEPGPVVIAIALAVWSAGTALTFVAQGAMGRSWRIGVDPEERTELVGDGVFRWVRNPIFVAMIVTQIGIVVLVPSVVAVAGLALAVVAIQIQVRLVEEPYLRATHGPTYEQYQRAVGRFVPRRLPAGGGSVESGS